MGKVLMGAVVSLDGYIAADDDTVGPLFDWYRNGDVEVVLGDPDRPLRVSAASAAYIRAEWAGVRATVIGRRLFDLTNGWGGVPAAGEHVVVVTHAPPRDWPFPDAPFTFVSDGVVSAVAQARAFASDGDVSVTAGNIGGQALAAGLVDEVHSDLVPVVLGSGKPFFGSFTGGPLLLEDARRVVAGDRVLHVIHPVRT
jgi:dihydrofolate reductase